MRVGLVVERRDLAIAGAAIERLRLDEAAVGLEPERLEPECPGLGFERREQARADAEAARLGSDPHALHFADAPLLGLERAAADRLAAEARDDERAHGRRQLVRVSGDAPRRIEAGVEAAAELAEILRHAPARIG